MSSDVYTFTLLDDDGVSLVASARSLRARYTRGHFDYSYPVELLTGQKAGELAYWETLGGGRVRVAVATGGAPPPATEGWKHVSDSALVLHDQDMLLVLPYSQYTFACAHRGGVPEPREHLVHRLSLPAGRYTVRIHQRTAERQTDEDFAHSEHHVLLT